MTYLLKRFVYLLIAALVASSLYADEKKYDKTNINRSDLYNFKNLISREKIKDEFEVELTGDNNPEYLIGDQCGNGGCQYYVFKNLSKQKYQYIGTIFLQRGGFEILATMHNGFKDILCYTHSSATAGILSRYEFTGSKYNATVSLQVTPDYFKLLRPTIR